MELDIGGFWVILGVIIVRVIVWLTMEYKCLTDI